MSKPAKKSPVHIVFNIIRTDYDIMIAPIKEEKL